MHDPAQALRTWLLERSEVTDLVDDQIAVGRHLFGDTWTTPSSALVLLRSGGDPDYYTVMRHSRLYAQCFGSSFAVATRIAATLVDLCKQFTRGDVQQPDGKVVILQLNQGSEVAQLWEGTLEVPAVGLYLDTFTAEVG